MQLARDIHMIDNNFSNESSGKSSRAGKKILTFIHGLGLACGLILSSWFLARTFQTTAPVASAPSVAPLEDPSDAFHASGPWGMLMVDTIYTEKPAHFIDVAPLLKSEEKWLFPGMDLGDVCQWMTTNGFDEKAIEELVTAEPEENPQGLYLHPTQKWIAALEPSQRKKMHTLLAKNSINHFSQNPYLFSPDVLQEIRSNPIMQGEIGELFDKLIYPRGTAMCLSDVGCLLFHLKDPQQGPEWLKLLTRNKTLLLKLEIDNSSDIPALVNYWSGPYNLKDFQPLLESFKRENRTTRLDVIHLLPPVARQIAYTYPLEDGVGERRDCHWTAINFFEESKNDKFLDLREIALELESHYVNVEKPEKFGDIIMFTPDGNDVLHSCVYIAADLVFTKNGMGVHQPWTISSLQEVATIYRDMKIIVKRRK
jgi:hypothetical protein